jgi:signal transduction histidine kinase
MLEDCGPLTELQQKLLKRSMRSAAKLRNIVNSLLEVGTSQTGRFDTQRFDVIQCSTDIMIDALETEVLDAPDISIIESDRLGWLESNGLHLSILDEIQELCIVQDKAKFICILGNLIRNCLRFRKSLVIVKLAHKGSNLEISISDDGPGIDLESIRKLFKHHLAEGTHLAHSKRKGHGLGFVSSVILARYLGGDIVVDSDFKEGARFLLTLPVSFDHKSARENGYDVDETDFITSC